MLNFDAFLPLSFVFNSTKAQTLKYVALCGVSSRSSLFAKVHVCRYMHLE